MEFFIQNFQESKLNKENKPLLSFMLGDAALTEKEISILCKRTNANLPGGRGLSSNEIMAYIYLKLYSCNGWYRYFSHGDFMRNLGVSDRDVYYILDVLEKLKLIKVYGDKYSHFRDIRIYHTGVAKKTRFLSLNRTYFKVGHDDYKKFLFLSAGAKSMMLYIMFMEKFKTDDHGNVIEINVSKITKYLNVKKETAIKYIKEVNEVWPNFLIIQKRCYGTSIQEQLAAIADKRIRYGAISSKTIRKSFTILKNTSFGFWRYFDFWLTSHGILERSVMSRGRKDHDYDSESSRIQENREILFKIVYVAAKKGISTYEIMKKFYSLVNETGFFDENVTLSMSRAFSHQE